MELHKWGVTKRLQIDDNPVAPGPGEAAGRGETFVKMTTKQTPKILVDKEDEVGA